MSLNGLFYLLLLDTDITLCHGGGGMLKQLLDKGDIISAVLVNLCRIKFPKAMGTDTMTLAPNSVGYPALPRTIGRTCGWSMLTMRSSIWWLFRTYKSHCWRQSSWITNSFLYRSFPSSDILKRERYYGKRFYSKKALVDMIENYIRYYNTRRVQRKLGVLTPMEKHLLYLAA